MKKLISAMLVLCLSLTLALPAAATQAEPGTDKSDVENTEAVGVMIGIGVIKGDPDGSLGLSKPCTRAQACKIIAYMCLGEDAAEAYPCPVAPFRDVSIFHWAAKYIKFCVDAGIISGIGWGYFAPEDMVTSDAWAKMLLCAAGYGEKYEYIGDDWKTAVAADVVNVGITSAAEYAVLPESLSRQECVGLAYAALTAQQVKYDAVTGLYVATGEGSLGAANFGDWFANNAVRKEAGTSIESLIKNNALASSCTISLNGGTAVTLNQNAGQLVSNWVWDVPEPEGGMTEGIIAEVGERVEGNTHWGHYEVYIVPSDYIGAGAALEQIGAAAQLFDKNADRLIDHIQVVAPHIKEVDGKTCYISVNKATGEKESIPVTKISGTITGIPFAVPLSIELDSTASYTFAYSFPYNLTAIADENISFDKRTFPICSSITVYVDSNNEIVWVL